MISAETIHGFTGSVLSERFDNPQPTPDFHKELWNLCVSDHKYVAIGAPRGHGKSTAVTHAYVLSSVLFREHDFVMIVSDTEGQAIQFLGDIKTELQENETLQELFGGVKFIKDTETNIIVQMRDRHKFRIIAKGSEQKVRGTKWNGKRPNLIVCDDLENEELTANPERREKFRQWFYGALLPCGSDVCKYRVVGTILHLDSLLERLLNDPIWVSRRFQAHNEDFSQILWPEKFSRERLTEIRQGYVNQGFPEGYYQEYLNLPIDPTNAYFRKTDFLPMRENDYKRAKNYYAAVDFAISQKEKADYTVIAVAGLDDSGTLHVEHVVRGRWDAKQIVDEMFAVQRRFHPDLFTVESGMIEKAIGPYIRDEMLRRGVFLNLNPMTPSKDKESRARSLQARCRAGGVRFDKEASWYQELEDEMLVFPKGAHDDQVDSLAWIGLTLDKQISAPTPQEIEDMEYEEELEEEGVWYGQGISAICGY